MGHLLDLVSYLLKVSSGHLDGSPDDLVSHCMQAEVDAKMGHFVCLLVTMRFSVHALEVRDAH